MPKAYAHGVMVKQNGDVVCKTRKIHHMEMFSGKSVAEIESVGV